MPHLPRGTRLLLTMAIAVMFWAGIRLAGFAQSVPENGSPFEQILVDISAPFNWYRFQGDSSGACTGGNADCGPTVVAMAVQFATNTQLKITEVRTFMGGTCHDTTTADQLRGALAHWNVDHTDLVGFDAVRTAVNERGHIVIVPAVLSQLTRGSDFRTPYPSSSQRTNLYMDPGNHWIVVKGFTTDSQGVEWAIVNDPLAFQGNGLYWYSDQTAKGQDRRYQARELATAMQSLGNVALEIAGAPQANNVSGVVKAASNGVPVSGATVVYADGFSRSPNVIRTGSDGRYAFTSTRTGNAIVTAIKGNQIGSVAVGQGGSLDITIGPSSLHNIALSSGGTLRTNFVSTGAPGDQTACNGVFSLSAPISETIYTDYLSFAGLLAHASTFMDGTTEPTFALQPGSMCAGKVYVSTDPTRALLTHPLPNTWMLAWEDYSDNDFNDLVVRLDLELGVPGLLASPIVADADVSLVQGAAMSLPPIDAFMDHRDPLATAPVGPVYDGTVTTHGDDSVEPGPFGSADLSYDGNTGTDFRVVEGTPIRAAAPGTVTFVGEDSEYCARTGQAMASRVVKVSHTLGYVTEYWGLAATSPGLVIGSVVDQDVIGTSGRVACSDRPGLHLVVRNADGTVVDPFGWHPRPDSYWAGVADPWQVANADIGRDATSYSLWTAPTQAQVLVPRSTTTSVASPSGAISLTLPSGASTAPIRVELTDLVIESQIHGQVGSQAFNVSAIGAGEVALRSLDKAMILSIQTTVTSTQRPALFVWDLQRENEPAWIEVPSNWDPVSRRLQAYSLRLGTFVQVNLPLTVHLPFLTRGP